MSITLTLFMMVVPPKSPRGKLVAEHGGTKMSEESMRQFVEELLLSRF